MRSICELDLFSHKKSKLKGDFYQRLQSPNGVIKRRGSWALFRCVRGTGHKKVRTLEAPIWCKKILSTMGVVRHCNRDLERL